MAAGKNTVTVEFKVIGDGIAQIQRLADAFKRLDTTGVRAAASAIKDLIAAQRLLTAEARTATEAGKTQAQGYKTQAEQAKALTAQVKLLAEQERLAAQRARIAAGGKSPGAAFAGNVGNVGQLAGLFGPVGQQAAGAASAVQTLVTSFVQLAAAGGPVGLAIGAVVVVLGSLVIGAGLAAAGIFALAATTIPKAEAMRAAFLGLQSVARFRGVDPKDAVQSVKDLDIVKNGLISVQDAATALKNLLQTGFSLEKSIQLIKAFGDTAAFGRQSALTFGYAIVSATEGVRNGNSILSDNAGVTKNLNQIMKEAGFTMQDLSDTTKGAAARQALFAGLMKETAAQTGDAEKLTHTYSGAIARLDALIEQVSAKIGNFFTQNQGLNDILHLLGDTVNQINKNFTQYAKGLSVIIIPLAIVIGAVIAVIIQQIALLVTAFGTLGKILGIIVESFGLLFGSEAIANRGAALNKLSSDTIDFAEKLALTAAKLPFTAKDLVANLVQDTGRLPGLAVFEQIITTMHDRNALSLLAIALEKKLTQEIDRQAAVREANLKRQQEIFSKTVDLERERKARAQDIVQKGALIGKNPLELQFAASQSKIEEEGDSRFNNEIERLQALRATISKQIKAEGQKKNPDKDRLDDLRRSLLDTNAAAEKFFETNRRLVETEKQLATIDFAAKFADQLRSKTIDLERERRAEEEAVARKGAFIGQNPVAAQLDEAQAKIAQASAKRITEEQERLQLIRAQFAKQIAAEEKRESPNKERLGALRESLVNVNEVAAVFLATNDALVERQKQLVAIDFAGKFADQLLRVNRLFFDIGKQMLDDNPYVAVFDSANQAVSNFTKEFGKDSADLEKFSAAVQGLSQKQLDRLEAQTSLKTFDLATQLQEFRVAAGLDSALSGEDRNRQLFDQFDRIRLQSQEGEKAATTFLIDAINSGQVDISALNGGQVALVQQAFADQAELLARQQADARQLAADTAAETKRIEDRRDETMKANSAFLDSNTASTKALVKTLEETDIKGEVRVVTASNLHADSVKPGGSLN